MYQIIDLFEAPVVLVTVMNEGVVLYRGDSPFEGNSLYNELVRVGDKPSITTKVFAIEWKESRSPSMDNQQDVQRYLSIVPARVRHVYNSILQKKPPKGEGIALAKKFHPHYFKQ